MSFDLETADVPAEQLRRVAIEPVTRVEGHGKVTLLLDEAGKVHQVRLHIVEFRGFERFIEGRPYWELPVLVSRLCGICPVSHHLAASKALDMIVGATRLTPTAEKMRRLMHYGQNLQSHALHFFHLSSPDLLFGFDSEVGQRNIVGVAMAHPEIAKQGILLRKYGQEVIRMTAGKRVHGTGAIAGGMNRNLAHADREALRAEIDQMIAWSQAAVKLCQQLHETQRDLHETFGNFASNSFGIVDPDGGLDLYHGGLRAKDPEGNLIFDHVDYTTYNTLLTEEVKPWSYMKFPYITQLGSERGWYKVGPLARVRNCDRIPTPLAEMERRIFLEQTNDAPLNYHWARMIEMLFSAEMIKQLIEDDDIEGTELLVKGERSNVGIGVIEAPRGTLFHHYEVGDDDLITMANLIVSTTNNNTAMNTAVREVARQYLDGQELTEGLLNHIEVAIRAFDPCLSCATHALGKMPLEVTLVDAGGTVIDQKYKQ